MNEVLTCMSSVHKGSISRYLDIQSSEHSIAFDDRL